MTTSPSMRKYRRSTDPLLARIKANKSLPRKYGDVTGTLDPYEVYRERARDLAAKSAGLERFAYNVFGPDLMASLAFALDPLSKTKSIGAKISGVNRTRKVTTVWTQPCSIHSTTVSESCTNDPDLSTPNPFDRTPVNCTSSIIFDSTSPSTGQQGYNGLISDTTIRTRPFDSKLGEFELFVPTIHAPSRNSSYSDYIESYFVAGGFLQVANSRKQYSSHGTGPAMTIDPSNINTVLFSERSDATSYFTKYGYGLIRDTLPEHPEFQLLYNVAELKDLPEMFRNTLRLFKDLQSQLFSIKGVGNQYLNLKFGWESTLSALKDLLYTPTRIAKRINYLLARRGVATTFRTRKKFLDGVSSIPPSTFPLHGFTEYNVVSSGTTSSRDIELRCMLNCTLDFPSILVPEVRSDLWTTLLGANPTPTDLYNLIPWTWLIDWFSGIGDYLTLIDRVSRDPSLINYGFLSYVSRGKVTYSYVTRTIDTHQIIYPPQPTWSQNTTNLNPYSAEFAYRYHRRIDAASISGVKAVSKPTTLSADQLAIIGALLTKWFHN
jgi:hypothetical protein